MRIEPVIEPSIEYRDDEFNDTREVRITLGPEQFIWNDTSNIDCPEDLCWSRDISEVFWAGYRMGRLAVNLENE